MYPVVYNNANHLSSLSHLNSNLNGNNVLLGSSGSNGSLVISSTTHHNPSSASYLDRAVKSSPNSLTNSTGSTDSPNSNNSSTSLLNTASLSNTYANPYAAHGYMASAAAAVACSRSTPTTFSMNNYYNPNQNAAYQELTNSLGLSNTLATTYNSLQQPDTMGSSNSSTQSYNNLILNTSPNTTTSNQSTGNYSSLVNSQCLSLVSNEQSANNNNSPNGTSNSFLIKTSNSPVATDLSSPNANLSSSSSSSSSSLSSSSYCERYTPLRNHRSIPYTNIKSAGGFILFF